MKATTIIKQLVDIVGKYGKNVELVVTPTKNSTSSSFTIKDLIDETGWIEITQD